MNDESRPQAAPDKGLTPAEHLLEVKTQAARLCDALRDASEEGVSPALLLPALVTVFRDAGMMPAGGLPGLLGN